MPALPGDHRDRAIALGGGDRLGGFLHPGFDRAAFLVEHIEFGRDPTRLVGVARGEQGHAEVRAAAAAAGVDPRAECEAEIARGRRAGEPRRFDQRSDEPTSELQSLMRTSYTVFSFK